MKDKYLDLSASMGCIVTGGPAEIHHVKCFNMGHGKVDHFLSFPLAHRLHRNGNDAFHVNQSLFQDRYGWEADLLARHWERVFAHLWNNQLPFA
jgi:hypothetical protein